MAARPSRSSTNSELGTLFAKPLAMRAAVLLICLLCVTGCDEKSPAGPTVPLNERFTLAPGEVATIDWCRSAVRVRPGDRRLTMPGRCRVHSGWRRASCRFVRPAAAHPTLLGLHTGDSSQASAVYRRGAHHARRASAVSVQQPHDCTGGISRHAHGHSIAVAVRVTGRSTWCNAAISWVEDWWRGWRRSWHERGGRAAGDE